MTRRAKIVLILIILVTVAVLALTVDNRTPARIDRRLSRPRFTTELISTTQATYPEDALWYQYEFRRSGQ